MRTKYNERQPIVNTKQAPSQISLIVKILVAVVLIAVVIMNVASVLPAREPVNVDHTPTAESESTLIFKAVADAQVEETSPTANAGTSSDLEVVRVTGQSIESYIRFTISGISGSIQSAHLRVYSTTNAADDGPALFATDNNWKETEINWENRPVRLGDEVANRNLIRSYTWVDYDVTTVVNGDGTYSFVLAGDSDEDLRFSSRESSNGPQLIITLSSAMPTSTPEATPEATAAGNTLTLTTEADAHVAQASPAENFGMSTDLQADGDPGAAQISFIRFDVRGINDVIQNVKLRVFARTGTETGPTVHFAANNWNESGPDGITWQVQPTLLSGPMNTPGTIEENSWVEYDVTAAVTGNGTYTFALVTGDPEGITLSSREGTSAPELVVTMGLIAPTPTVNPTSQASPGGVTLVGAGDIATCNRDEDELTAQLLDDIPGTVFAAGDNAYVDGAYSEYINCYDPSWGRHKSRTKPIPGNHEYNTSGAAGYFQYFENIPPYYAYDLGSWRIYALNSEIDTSLSSPQVAWLVADLAANPRQCVLAYWHRPRWSSGTNNGSEPAMQTLWQIFYEAGAELVINGHEHQYERFVEMDGSGAEVSEGLREIVVGTGGAGLYPFGTPLTTSEVRDDTSFGVLKLNLHTNGYDWEFIPAANSSFRDSGSDTCR